MSNKAQYNSEHTDIDDWGKDSDEDKDKDKSQAEEKDKDKIQNQSEIIDYDYATDCSCSEYEIDQLPLIGNLIGKTKKIEKTRKNQSNIRNNFNYKEIKDDNCLLGKLSKYFTSVEEIKQHYENFFEFKDSIIKFNNKQINYIQEKIFNIYNQLNQQANPDKNSDEFLEIYVSDDEPEIVNSDLESDTKSNDEINKLVYVYSLVIFNIIERYVDSFISLGKKNYDNLRLMYMTNIIKLKIESTNRITKSELKNMLSNKTCSDSNKTSDYYKAMYLTKLNSHLSNTFSWNNCYYHSGNKKCLNYDNTKISISSIMSNSNHNNSTNNNTVITTNSESNSNSNGAVNSNLNSNEGIKKDNSILNQNLSSCSISSFNYSNKDNKNLFSSTSNSIIKKKLKQVELEFIKDIKEEDLSSIVYDIFFSYDLIINALKKSNNYFQKILYKYNINCKIEVENTSEIFITEFYRGIRKDPFFKVGIIP